ncbi:SIR2 family protein [Carnobacterium mobile]|uniref:SIR2 family protein n=1 Tax=Carnobacterium mobile TaxID=2750 RepID=UPI002458D018|nr:SIR2 family protein [Carnobacterium mobile]
MSTYWTTNYDNLIEKGLELNDRKADIKMTQQSLADNIYDRDAVVYKMHGDSKLPAQAVLTKDDYEIYENERPLFRTVLQGDLVSKTFVFIGFSFEDPNLNYVLGQIRVLLKESTRDHYCFFEKVKQEKGEIQEDFLYRKAKQKLRIEDLQRYGIQAITLDSYSEITNLLSEIENGYLRKNIFISGSASIFAKPWTKEKCESLAYLLSKELVCKNYKVISGFGLGIGSSVVNGALEEIMSSKFKHIDEHLSLRPFPQTINGLIPKEDKWKEYRTDMISQSGIAIFMFGNKLKDENPEIAMGVLNEYKIAKKNNVALIPIGSTGWAAREIFNEVSQNISDYPYLEEHIDILSKSNDQKQLINTILKIIDSLQVF